MKIIRFISSIRTFSDNSRQIKMGPQNPFSKRFIRIANLMVISGLLLIHPLQAIVKENYPNIVIILADDLGYGDVGCYNPTTGWLYAYVDGDRIPVPPNKLLDKDKLPDHPYSHDCRLGMVADNFDHEEVDLVFLHNEYPERVIEMKKQMDFCRESGRSAPLHE